MNRFGMSVIREKGDFLLQQVSSRTKSIVESSRFLYFCFGWFIFQAVYMATVTKPGISPDEPWHLGFIQLFTQNGFLPFIHDQSGFYWLGESVHTPFIMYHYLLSLPYHLLQHASTAFAVVSLRLINIGLAVASLYVVVKLANRLHIPRFVRNLSIFMLVNTLMFVFLSSSINYDNLFVLVALISFYLLLGLLKTFNARDFLGLMALIPLGLLTNINFLPIALALAIIVFVLFASNHTRNGSMVRNFVVTHRSWRLYLVYAVAILVILLFAQRYITNVVQYHTFAPACDKVNSLAQCDQYPVFHRNMLLYNSPKPAIGLSVQAYAAKWIGFMGRTTFGILAQQDLLPSILIRKWWPILLLISAVAFARKFSPRRRQVLLLLCVTAFYVAVLFAINYRGYQETGVSGIAVQGRYMFAFLPILFIIGNSYVLQLLKHPYIQATYIIITLVIFSTASLPTYIIQSSPSWHASATGSVNEKLRSALVDLYRPFVRPRS